MMLVVIRTDVKRRLILFFAPYMSQIVVFLEAFSVSHLLVSGELTVSPHLPKTASNAWYHFVYLLLSLLRSPWPHLPILLLVLLPLENKRQLLSAITDSFANDFCLQML